MAFLLMDTNIVHGWNYDSLTLSCFRLQCWVQSNLGLSPIKFIYFELDLHRALFLANLTGMEINSASKESDM